MQPFHTVSLPIQSPKETANAGDKLGQLTELQLQNTPVYSNYSIEFETEYISDKLKDLKVQELSIQHDLSQKKLMLKIDMCLVPGFMLLVFVSFLNKSLFGLMLVSGITTSFKIDSLQYSGALAGFFVPYCILQVGSNYILKRVRAHFWISLTVLCYGAVGIGSAFSKSFGVFCFCQVLHGFLQAGSETAAYYILAHYYNKREAARRFTLIYSSSCIGALASTLLAYASEARLEGAHGLESWRWLLILCGAITMASSFIIFFTFPDFPEGARFLNDDEAYFLVKKLAIFTGKSGYNLKFSVKECLIVLLDPLVWLPALICFCISFIVIGVTTIYPLLFVLIGYTGLEAKRKAIIPWVVTFVWSNIWSFASDKVRLRVPFVFGNTFLVLIGGIMISTNFTVEFHDKIKYYASYLLFAGGYSALPLMLCWASLNLGGHLRKSVGLALQISFASIGGLVSYWAFVGKTPQYKTGILVGLSITSFGLFLILTYFIYLVSLNKKKRSAAYKEAFNRLSERNKIALGDKSPDFDYMY